MLRLLRGRRGDSLVPNLVVAQRVLHKMAAAAAYHIGDETGEAMVGLMTPGSFDGGLPTLYILDTISPDESAIRMMHTFQQGDERQDEAIFWLQENWQVERRRRKRSKFDVPLRYLGDWHKQPGYMIQPSGGDLMTALDWIDDPENNMDFLLAPIVTLDHPHTVGAGIGVNYVMVPNNDGTALRVDFWYIDREWRVFLPIAPVVYPDDQLPGVAPYSWRITNEARFMQEMTRLKQDDLFVSMMIWDADGAPPLEVCFLVARMGADKMLIVVTPYDYPLQPPSVRVAPFTQLRPDMDMYEVFKDSWAKSEPIALDGVWSPDKQLGDLIAAAEAKLGIQRPQKPEQAPIEAPANPVVNDKVIDENAAPSAAATEPETEATEVTKEDEEVS